MNIVLCVILTNCGMDDTIGKRNVTNAKILEMGGLCYK